MEGLNSYKGTIEILTLDSIKDNKLNSVQQAGCFLNRPKNKESKKEDIAKLNR